MIWHSTAKWKQSGHSTRSAEKNNIHCPHAWTSNLSLIKYQNRERRSRDDTALAGIRRLPGDLLSGAFV